MTSLFDRLYRQLIFTGFFKRGWGDPGHIKDLLQLRVSLSDPASAYAVQLTDDLLRNVRIEIEKETRKDKVVLIDASFTSPLHSILPHVMPVECQKAKFQLMFNEKTSIAASSSSSADFDGNNHNNGDGGVDELLRKPAPVTLHLAGTGDHFFYRFVMPSENGR